MILRKIHATLFIFALLAGGQPSVSADDSLSNVASEAPAYGFASVTVGCDKADDGIKITFIHTGDFHGDSVPHTENIQPGDPCLPVLAQFPQPFVNLIAYARLNPQAEPAGKVTQIRLYILEDEDAYSVSGVVACGINEMGYFVTKFVDLAGNPDSSSYIGKACGDTLGGLTKYNSTRLKGSLFTSLGYDSTGMSIGGIIWLLTAPDDAELLECNMNAQGDQLIVTYHETPRGIDNVAIGKPCLAMLQSAQEQGLRLRSNTPIAQEDIGASLIFDFDAGGVSR